VPKIKGHKTDWKIFAMDLHKFLKAFVKSV